MKKLFGLIAFVCLLSGLLTGCAVSSEAPSPIVGPDWSRVNKIIIVQDREIQSTWTLTDGADIAAIHDMFESLKYGNAQTGGGAGAFLQLQFFDGDSALSKVVFFSPSEIQYVYGDAPKVLPITENFWTPEQWNAFLEGL